MKGVQPRLVGLIAVLPLFLCHIGFGATHTLTISTNGNGTVARNPTNSVYPGGSVVTLTALPASGWSFSSWSGDASGTNNPLNVTMDANKVITASFSQIPSSALTVNISGDGSVNPPGGSFLSNTVVSLTAIPSNGWVFGSWIGAASGNLNPLAVTMDGNKNITATFGQLPSITVQPQSTNASLGATVTLNVGAAGSAPLLYQWQSFGSPLADQTNASLTLTNVQAGGEYRVRVSNAYGTATSQVAVLTVECAGTNVVSTCTDSALRQAMSLGGLVRLCCNGTIVLTSTIAVTKDTTLDASENLTVISGNNAVRLFEVSTNIVFTLTNVGLINGNFISPNSSQLLGGAAILSRGGTVRLVGCVFSNNAVRDSYGGAVACVGGSLTITNSLFVNNIANGSIATPQKDVRGGALYAADITLAIQSSTFLTNTILADSTVTFPGQESSASLFGGAIMLESGTAKLARVEFRANVAAGGYSRNGTAGPAQGGAIFNTGTLQIQNCSFATNSAVGGAGFPPAIARGGAICNVGSLLIVSSVIHDNLAQGGYGRAMFGGGADAFGGAMFNSGEIAGTNLTMNRNTSLGGVRGNFTTLANGNAYGGAVFNDTGTIMMINATIAGNVTTSLGAATVGANIANTNATFLLRNSLIAYPGTSANAWGTVTDGGYNISSDGSANFSSGSSFNFTEPKLLPLANNGGPTLTMALASDSPALDWAPATGAPATDQRGVPRPFGTGVDLGAFEAGPLIPPLLARHNGSSLNLSFDGQAGFSYRIERSTDLLTWELQEVTGILATNGVVLRTIPTNGAKQFFRLSLAL